MKTIALKVMVAMIIGTSSSFALAQSSSTINTTIDEKSQSQRSYSLSLSLNYLSNMYAENTYESEKSMRFQVIPAYQISEFFALSSLMSVEKQTNGPGNTILANTPVSLSYNRYRLAQVINVTNRVTAVLPTNKEVVKQDTFEGAISVGNEFSYSFKSVPLKSSYGISLGRNIHKYNRNFQGAPNIEYSLAHSVNLQLNISKDIDISTGFFYKQARTYHGYGQNSFYAMAALNYEYQKSLRMTVGTSNDGNAFKANGRDSNIQFFNERSSVLFVGMSYSI